MNIKHLVRLVLILTLACLAYACTEEELDQSREAEAHYVDLLYALSHHDQATARKASTKLSHYLSLIQLRWYRPMKDEEVDNMHYHLAKAERAYAESRTSIAEGQLELAAVQLDRAVYELYAADPVAFNELYVGSIYDFVATWTEVNRVVNDQELCSLVWTEFSRYGKDARRAWQEVKWRKPSQRVYQFTEQTLTDFHLSHSLVDDSIDHFIAVVKTGDQCAAQLAAKEVDEALWTLVLLFGSEQLANL
jgi:hypothetical protein